MTIVSYGNCALNYYAATDSKLLPLLLSTLTSPIVVTQEAGHGTPPAMGQHSRKTLHLILKTWDIAGADNLMKKISGRGTKSGKKREDVLVREHPTGLLLLKS